MFIEMQQKIVNAAKLAKAEAKDLPLRAGIAAAALVGPALAHAQAADADAAIASAGAKILGYAAAVVGIMVAFWGTKRAGQKMGWW